MSLGFFFGYRPCDNGVMQDEKTALRQSLTARRKALTPEVVSAASRDIAQKVPSVTEWQRVKNVHIYRSLASLGEVDTQPIIDWLARVQPHIAVTVGASAPGVPFPEGDFEVIFVPVLGFDRGRFRLGMGGGWYDRWLATQPRAYKIGLAYAWAEVENLPHEPHDIPLNQILVD